MEARINTKNDYYGNLEIFANCKSLNERIFINQTKTFSLCFGSLIKPNHDIQKTNYQKHYFLTLMDNLETNSCPNCISRLISNENQSFETPEQILKMKLEEIFSEKDFENAPSWFQQTIDWYVDGQISESEIMDAINFILERGH